MKERKLYSLTGKPIVFLLLIVFAASALFGGIQTLMLSSVGLTPNAAAKKYAFEETTACGTLVQRQLHNVMSYYNDMSKFGTNGRYDGTKEIDYRAFATDGEGSGGISPHKGEKERKTGGLRQAEQPGERTQKQGENLGDGGEGEKSREYQKGKE